MGRVLFAAGFAGHPQVGISNGTTVLIFGEAGKVMADDSNQTINERRYVSLVAVRNYRLFFIGQLLSMCGTWMSSIAQSTYILFRLNGGGRELGYLSAATFIPSWRSRCGPERSPTAPTSADY